MYVSYKSEFYLSTERVPKSQEHLIISYPNQASNHMHKRGAPQKAKKNLVVKNFAWSAGEHFKSIQGKLNQLTLSL